MAYRKAASIQNADSGFRKAGLWSLTIYIFQDSDFAAATVTNVIMEAAQEHNPMPPLTPTVAAPALTAVSMETTRVMTTKKKKLCLLGLLPPKSPVLLRPLQLNREHTTVLIQPNLVDCSSSRKSKAAERVNGALFCTMVKSTQT